MFDVLKIPDCLAFHDLALSREPRTRRLLFAAAPLAAMCRANGLDPDVTLADEDFACALICEWYVAHIEAGGKPDPVVEETLAEISAVEEYGSGDEEFGAANPEHPGGNRTDCPRPSYH